MSQFAWIALALVVFSVAQAAPAIDSLNANFNSPALDLDRKIDDLYKQFEEIKRVNDERDRILDEIARKQNPVETLQRNTRYMSFQPMKKRMASWQPMKRNADYSKEQVIRAIEEQLSEIIRAGETLGVNADEVLTHLRQRGAGLA